MRLVTVTVTYRPLSAAGGSNSNTTVIRMADRSAVVNERGFTLAELLVASAVLGIIMFGVLTVQRQGLSAYLVGAGRVEVQQNARAALETMLNEVRLAQAVTAVPAGCGTGPVPTGGGATSISINDQNGVARHTSWWARTCCATARHSLAESRRSRSGATTGRTR